jgi:hypothetical protein
VISFPVAGLRDDAVRLDTRAHLCANLRQIGLSSFHSAITAIPCAFWKRERASRPTLSARKRMRRHVRRRLFYLCDIDADSCKAYACVLSHPAR